MRWWAPHAREVRVRLADRCLVAAADPDAAGWFVVEDEALQHGVDYELLLDGEAYPDPLARWLPGGVHAAARVFDPALHAWTDGAWSGRALDAEAVVYELHVGTFTAQGSLDAAATRLPELAALGVSHVELLPLAAFDGTHGWGYDGVAINAVHAPYGGPEALCRFVEAAHAQGIAVLLDVVHNHLGPSGNNWPRFGPLFSERHHSPWGPAVNLDGPGSADVRDLLVGSALAWLRDFHLDGLRLDAVHELKDRRARHYLQDLSAAVEALAGQVGRPLALVAESDRNDPRTVTATALGGLGMTAQWDDDVHHALHWLLTGETGGYYADFGSAAAVTHALSRAFLHDGRYSSFRRRRHGRRVDFRRTPPTRFLAALQTHDQVGNRAAGERLSQLVGVERLAAGAALLLALPYVPMLFMGEEWGASTPWLFFTSFPDAELGAAVTEGRRAEFAAHGWGDEVPDPQDPTTYARSVLDWDERARGTHAQLLSWYTALIAWRRSVPASGDPSAQAGPVVPARRGSAGGGPRWYAVSAGQRSAVVNLSAEPLDLELTGDGPAVVDHSWPSGGCTVTGSRLALGPSATAVGRWLTPR